MRSKIRGWRSGCESGNAAVELAILLPVLALITFGVIDFARAFYAYVTVASAAHEAVVYLAEEISSSPDVTILQAAADTESKVASTSFLTFGASGNSTLTPKLLVASTTGSSYVRLELMYKFTPLTGIPFAGQVPITVSAAAPRAGAI